MKNYIAAVDLGTTKIVALLGEKTDFERYKILASCEIPSKGIVRGEVENPLHVTELIKDAVYTLKKESGLEFSDIYVGIAGQHINCSCESVKDLRDKANVQITQTEIDALQRKMYSMRMEPGEEILHVIPQSYNIDDRMDIREPVGMLGKELTGNYHIVIGKTNAMDAIKLCLNNEKVNLKLNRLILEPLASAAAVLDDDEKEMGVALVDIGGGTTDLVVYYDNVVRHTAVIPFGGNIVTEDIRNGCGILRRIAELIKIQYGSCLGNLSSDNTYFAIGKEGGEQKEISFKTLSEIIDARMEEILGAIMFEIDRSGFADKLNAGIVFTGGGSMLTNFKQFAELKTGLSARIGKPVYLSGADSKLAQPYYSTAVGLVIKGLEYEEKISKQDEIVTPQQNLFPELEPVIVPVDPEDQQRKPDPRPRRRNIISDIINKIPDLFSENNNDV
ncbi:MAG: cell division protein FtsA [Prevotellaceae bacterium]|jgi:cell division protein FtsA|nr:cell division protein FtsA [Prevotellaceae bacterium]